MSWVPPDMADLCRTQAEVSSCAPGALMFLSLVTRLFGRSRDEYNFHSVHPPGPTPKWGTAWPGGYTAPIPAPGDEYGFHNIHPPAPGDRYDFHGIHPPAHTPLRGTAWPGGYTATVASSHPPAHTPLRGTAWPGGYTAPAASNPAPGDRYDFIVVGAGSAGCVVANRLSAVKKWKVLLLEAGGEEPEVAEIPAFAPILQRSSLDWGYRTMPQEHACKARQDGRCGWARGKVLGGSSSINYMIYVRGNAADYDAWQAQGNPGWSYDHVLPYFLRSEDNGDPIRLTKYHHVGGYQAVEWFPYQDGNVAPLLDAWQEMGYDHVDVNAEGQIGVTKHQTTSRAGERQSTNAAFLRPVRRTRANLHVVTRATATRLLVDAATKHVVGVEYSRHGRLHVAHADKEVVLSAGAINSPKILMCSGIGPALDLERNHIQVIKDLAVGFNLQDHVTTDGVILSINTSTLPSPKRLTDDTFEYLHRKTGPLTATGLLQVGAFVQTRFEHAPGLPDVQYSFDAVNVADFYAEPAAAAQRGASTSALAYYDGIQIRPILMTPRSRGRVRLNLTDPVWGDPLIYPGYFTAYPDLDVLVAGIQLSLELLKTRPMRDIGAHLVPTPLPSCRTHPLRSDAYWECVAQHYTATIFHPVGTCKMGPRRDADAVVDAKLRVHGVKGVRVIDASIMPTIVRGNTNAPVIMIAEKGSEMIIKHWLRAEKTH